MVSVQMSVKVECHDDCHGAVSVIKLEAGHAALSDDFLSRASISSADSSSPSDASSSSLSVYSAAASSVLSTSKSAKRLAETSCFVCAKWFCGKSARDQHLVTHFGTLSDAIMSGSDRWLVANSVMNECPLCGCVTSKRKGLRHHLILRHVLREPDALDSLMRRRSSGGGGSAVDTLCAVDQRERDLVRMLLGSPKLLWKRADEEQSPRRKSHNHRHRRKNVNKVFIQ